MLGKLGEETRELAWDLCDPELAQVLREEHGEDAPPSEVAFARR